MVSVRINFYSYREKVKGAILQRIEDIDSNWDPFVASWLAYALFQEREEYNNNKPLTDLIKRLKQWSKENEAWDNLRSLGALCFLGYFLNKISKIPYEFTIKILERVEQLKNHNNYKFSPLNDPEQVFPMALLIGSLREVDKLFKQNMRKIIYSRMRGPLKRRILYMAALKELGKDIDIHLSDFTGDIRDPGDIIALIWFWERYRVPGERARWWKAFENIRNQLSLESTEGIRILSPSEIALLYEALIYETKQPDPNLLFDLYPLHPRIREVCKSLFKSGEYKNAVEEAAKALNTFIQQKTKSEKSEEELIQSVMNLNNPKLKFNSYLNTPFGKSEQAGLAMIARGIFRAFRNPKAHIPKDDPRVKIDAFEALDQLVIISYIFKRIEKSEV